MYTAWRASLFLLATGSLATVGGACAVATAWLPFFEDVEGVLGVGGVLEAAVSGLGWSLPGLHIERRRKATILVHRGVEAHLKVP
jgi:hypothetical protein